MNHSYKSMRWLAFIFAAGLVAAMLLHGAITRPSSVQAQDTDVFLPHVRDDAQRGSGEVTPAPTQGATATPAPTQGATATPSPTPTMTPPTTPTLDPQASAYDGKFCPEDFHLIHESGVVGVIDPAEIDFVETAGGGDWPVAAQNRWDGYYCVPDDDLSDISCSGHGTANLLDGVATCSCETGYVGAQCNLCAPGYAASNDDKSCEPAPDPTPAVVVRGAGDSVERDTVVELSSVVSSSDDASAAETSARAKWEISHGYGCLLPAKDAATCLSTHEGESVFFKAPPGEGLNATGIRVTSFSSSGSEDAPFETTVLAQPPGYIPINGYGQAELQPILDKLIEFMKARCVGAAVLGVAYYGKPVGAWGLGKTFGRASSTIFDPACGPDNVDPHYPAASNTGNQMGIMIGSVSKTVTFATTRWALKDALASWDVDVDLTPLTASRLVSAQRRPNGQVRLEAWSVNSGGVTSKEGNATTQSMARDFSLTRLNDGRVAAALRTPSNGLQVIVWDVNSSGQFTERHVTDVAGLPGTAGDTIKQVRVARVADDKLIAALRRADDTLALVMWQVNGNGTLTELVGLSLNTIRVRDVDVIVLDGATLPRVIVALRAVDNTLDVRWYEVGADNNLLLRDESDTNVLIEDLDITPLSSTRFAAALRLHDGNLRVMSWAVKESPYNVWARDAENAGAIGDLAISRIGQSGFAVVVRQSNTNLKLITWVLDGDGNLTRRGDDTAGTNNGAALSNLIFGSDTLNSILFAAVRTGSHTLKLIPWNVTGPTPSRLANEGDGASIADYAWTDTDIEAMRLVGFDLPQGFLPEPNRQLFAGEAPLPIQLPGASLDTNDDGNIDAQCSALAGLAAPEWQQAQLRHLFGHRTGMAKSFSPNAVTLTKDYLDDLRGLTTQQDWADQEAALRAQWGDANVEAARSALGWNTNLVNRGSTDGYLIEAPTLREILEAIASRCLPYAFGSSQYSNASPQILRIVIEHVTGRSYVFPEGYPQEHMDTLFYDFFDSQLELNTSPVDNIFPHRPGLEGPDDMGPPGPRLRAWDSGKGSYYWDAWDRKRPHCDWDGNTCKLDNWNSANGGRINWYWAKAKVIATYYGNTGGTATGGLRAEPESWLKFMTEFWTGGYGSGSPASFNPFIGEARNNTWGINTNHNGSVGGGYAYTIHRSNGVDLFVAVNQSGGKSDVTGDEYGTLYTMMVQGINAIDWSSLNLIDDIQIAP